MMRLVDSGSNPHDDRRVNLDTGMIARSPVHVFAAYDTKEAGDATELPYECIVEPDFGGWVKVRPTSQGKSCALFVR
jgi:hypothetical protein